MRRLFFVTILLTIYPLLLTRPAHAAGEFAISYDNFYQLTRGFNLSVKQKIKITNLTTQYYVAEFSITLGNVKIKDLSAQDETGSIAASVDFDQNQTQVKLNFKSPVVGKGNTKNFSLNYSVAELVNKTGQILEVSIPKLANDDNIDQYNVTLMVPANFGPAAYITPEPNSSQSSGFGGNSNYFFDKGKLLKSGITAAFGTKQVFSFNLIYHLIGENNSFGEIALPPDNAYQKVLIETINPEPSDTRVDPDGNWLATYQIPAGKKVDVRLSGYVEVYPKPKFKESVPENPKTYLKTQKYWETNDQYFREKAAQLKTPRQIYDFVTSFLSYNQERLTATKVERFGAAAAVKNPKDAVCMEFTDLFITMARATGIPAREINGYAASANDRLRPLSLRNLGADILHAWPEFWDEQLQVWVQVDPTWGTTSGGIDYFSKLDFNHITFVQKGFSSTYPVPAGGYKTDPGQTGDVKVLPAENLPEATFEPSLSIEIPKILLSGRQVLARVIVKNLSNQAIFSDPLKIQAENLNLKTPSKINLGVLPPNASRLVKIELDSRGLLENKKGLISASYGSATTSAVVQIRPSIFFILSGLLVGVILLTGVTLLVPFGLKKFLKTGVNS